MSRCGSLVQLSWLCLIVFSPSVSDLAVQKTPEEVKASERRRKEKEKLKLQRRQRQEANVAKKQQEKADHTQRCVAGQQTAVGSADTAAGSDSEAEGDWSYQPEEEGSDVDDQEYYRQEVGEEPGEDFMPTNSKRGFKRKAPRADGSAPPAKKARQCDATGGVIKPPRSKQRPDSKFSFSAGGSSKDGRKRKENAPELNKGGAKAVKKSKRK